MTLAGQVHRVRKGLLLRVESEQGQTALAEVSPLPGLHTETFGSAFAELVAKLKDSSETPAKAPSVRMALDLIGLQLQQRMTPHGGTKLKLRALVVSHEEGALNTAISSVAQGYEALKIKVGGCSSLRDELRLLKGIRDTVGPKIQMDLDANRAWSLGDAVEFGHACSRIGLQCIEEPVKDLLDLPAFVKATGIKAALDESLHGPEAVSMETLETLSDSLHALVVKPSLIGGLERLVQLKGFADARGLDLVISATAESGVGLNLWSWLAAEYGQPGVAHGLGTFAWLQNDVVSPPFRPFRGKIEVANFLEAKKQFDPSQSPWCKRIWSLSEGA